MDQEIGGEDFTSNGVVDPLSVWNVIDGVNAEFHTAYKPLVDGTGYGILTTSTASVVVTVDGQVVPVQTVDGLNGIITLVDAPAVGSTISGQYSFKRTDTYLVGENLTAQADGVTSVFQVDAGYIVDGKNGGQAATAASIGTTANTTAKNGTVLTVPVISVTVNGSAAVITDVNGGAGTFTLSVAPAANATVLVSYFANDYAGTFDIIPSAKVNSLISVGYKPNDNFYRVGTSCVLAGNNQVYWGSTALVNPGVTTAGTGNVQFGPTQVSAVVVDNKYYGLQISATGDGSTKAFTLPYVPTRGDGTGKPLSDDISEVAISTLLKVYVGTSYHAAILAGPVALSKVSGQVVTLRNAPASGTLLFVDQYVSNLTNDNWTVASLVSGATGTYSVTGTTYGPARQVNYSGTSSISPEPVYLDGVKPYVKPSATYTGTDTITVLAAGATGTIAATLGITSTSLTTGGTGTAGKTFIDPNTGFTLTTPANLQNGTLVYNVSPTFAIRSASDYSLFGLKFGVTNTAGVVVGDTVVISALDLISADQPDVGSIYTVTFKQARTDFSPKYITTTANLISTFGPITQSNKVAIGANLALQNGAPAVIVLQIPKTPGQSDAAVADYLEAIDVFDDPISNGVRATLMQPLSTDPSVINYLKTSNSVQSSIRYRNERMSYFGFRLGTTPDAVINRVRALGTQLLTAVYPDGGFITVKDDTNTYSIQVQVGGEYVAAAMAGLDASPAQDIATPLTNNTLSGFNKLSRALTTVVASQVANAGTTVLEYIPGGTVRVMMALTTDTTSVLTRDPRIVGVSQFVQKGVRSACDPFIGMKNLPGLTGRIETALKQYFKALVDQKLIAAVQGISAVVNSADPTTVDVTAYYSPVLPLNWIVVTLNLSSQG
jgi:hypothetical protein